MKLKLIVYSFTFFLFAITTTTKAQDFKKNRGFFNTTSFGYLWGKEANQIEVNKKVTGTSIETVTGFFVNPHLSLGVGVGINAYTNYETFPVFFDARGYLKDKKNTAFAFLQLGESVDALPVEEGLFMGLGIGYKFFTSDKLCLNVAATYNRQWIDAFHKTSETFDPDSNTVTIEENEYTYQVNSLRLSVGICF